jgi:hypothetical protein
MRNRCKSTPIAKLWLPLFSGLQRLGRCGHSAISPCRLHSSFAACRAGASPAKPKMATAAVALQFLLATVPRLRDRRVADNALLRRGPVPPLFHSTLDVGRSPRRSPSTAKAGSRKGIQAQVILSRIYAVGRQRRRSAAQPPSRFVIPSESGAKSRNL